MGQVDCRGVRSRAIHLHRVWSAIVRLGITWGFIVWLTFGLKAVGVGLAAETKGVNLCWDQ